MLLQNYFKISSEKIANAFNVFELGISWFSKESIPSVKSVSPVLKTKKILYCLVIFVI